MRNLKKNRVVPGGFRTRYLRPAALALLAAALIPALYFALRPKPLWYGEEQYERLWTSLLRECSLRKDLPAPPFTRFMAYKPWTPPPEDRFGFIITAAMGQSPYRSLMPRPASPEGEAVVYPGVSGAREYRGAPVLAVNPWMIFRKHRDLPLSRSRIDAPAGGEGLLLLAGNEDEAVWAWTSQLIQERPGFFPGQRERWETAAVELSRNPRFQSGSLSYSWQDLWFELFREDRLIWVYAPLSKVQELPGYRTSVLESDRFPEPEDWNLFGIQADLLWAIPFGEQKYRKQLDRALAWLQDPEIQTFIAAELGWVPAVENARVRDPISHAAHLLWLSSSFVWQPAEGQTLPTTMLSSYVWEDNEL